MEDFHIDDEIIVRDVRLTPQIKASRQRMIKFLALSLGLINKKESRDLVLYLLDVLFSLYKEKREAEVEEITKMINEIAGKNYSVKAVYYQIEKLVEKGIIEKRKGYVLSDKLGSIEDTIEEKYMTIARNAFGKVREVIRLLKTI